MASRGDELLVVVVRASYKSLSSSFPLPHGCRCCCGRPRRGMLALGARSPRVRVRVQGSAVQLTPNGP